MRVVFFHRQPGRERYSVEGLFSEIRRNMPPEVECVVAISRYESRGLFPRLYNIIEAFLKQGDVNHITGDVHFLTYLLSKKKTLLTILDCGFAQKPSPTKRYFLRLFWYIIPEKRVQLISVISQSAKDELLKHIRCKPEKIRIVPAGISPIFVFKDKDFNSEKPGILQVGTAPNKNLLRVIEALHGIPCHLDVVGKLSAEHKAALDKYKIAYSNSWNLSDEEMVRKYQESDMVVFVSTHEGFGLPILEANAVGRPVITSNISSMPEVAGDAACFVNPFDVASIRAGILQVINDKAYREQLIQNGHTNKLRYSLEISAKMYCDLYRELLNG